ncbi:MAG: hypothetical protein RLZZ373_3214 [Pseudomonadota bacterium]
MIRAAVALLLGAAWSVVFVAVPVALVIMLTGCGGGDDAGQPGENSPALAPVQPVRICPVDRPCLQATVSAQRR